MKRYSVDHEWVEVRDGVAFVGISAHAAEELGDITFVELPQLDEYYKSGDTLGVIESVKAASDVYAPVSGKVVELNGELENHPETVNESPEEDGWFCKIELDNADELEDLMDEEAYAEYLER